MFGKSENEKQLQNHIDIDVKNGNINKDQGHKILALQRTLKAINMRVTGPIPLDSEDRKIKKEDVEIALKAFIRYKDSEQNEISRGSINARTFEKYFKDLEDTARALLNYYRS